MPIIVIFAMHICAFSWTPAAWAMSGQSDPGSNNSEPAISTALRNDRRSTLLSTDNSAQDFLPVDQAFVLDIVANGEDLTLIWTIAADYYLYKHRFKLSLAGRDVTEHTFFSEARETTDDYFGKVEVYLYQAIAELSGEWLTPPDAAHNPRVLRVEYQGCAEAGLCYPVQITELALDKQ